MPRDPAVITLLCCLVEPGGAAGIEALRGAGLTIVREPRRHEGQGTASVAAIFENAHLELIEGAGTSAVW